MGDQIITVNRKARHDYSIEDTVEAGIVLTGTEIKSVRASHVNLKEAYARELLDFQDACNQLVGRLVPGVSPLSLSGRLRVAGSAAKTRSYSARMSSSGSALVTRL